MATVKMAGTLPLNRGGARGGGLVGASALSPESAVASEIFDQLVAATTFKAVLHLYRQICELLRLRPTNLLGFYPRLKAKLKSWKATNLWTKLDKRASHKCYNRGRACPNSRVLIIGAGPCGLRAAIECQLLGAKVVVLEKRDRFSRNNVLHLWPFVIYDLRNLGAKKFFGKFCAGSIDHISIRQLQLILLKVALLLGVEVHENVTFEQLLEPPLDQSQERVGWRAKVSPADHPVSQYEFDALIGADGKRNTLLGFNRKEFRGKLAIAVTANFINRQTMEEASVPEISGVAFIFNQKFFQDMREQTGVDLENIVYYKDDTHYFVMTAKKQSLLDQGVIINDYSDTARLLSPDNVDRQMLMRYAREAADFATNGQMPHLDFAVNHYGQADVAMFDFTSMYAAENACRMVERRGHRLLQSLVGDCLLEPFWPTGSGCARGFLSALDAAWMVRSWSSGKKTPLQVLAEREACYRLLAQTTPENLHKDLNLYTLNPTSRYPNLNLLTVLPSQVRCLCDTDTELQDHLPDVVPELLRKKRRRMSLIHPDALLSWCQRQVSLTEGVMIENLSTSWKTGLALCAILHRYRPDLVDIGSLNPADAAKNNQLAFDICEREYGIPPIMTGQEMAECEVPDKLAMVAYLTQIYDTFRGEIPYLVRPIKSVPEEATSETNQQGGLLSKFSHRLHGKRSRYSVEKESHRESGEGIKRTKTPSSLTHRRRSRDKDKGIAQNTDSEQVTLTGFNKILQQQQRREEEEQIREEVQQAIIGKDQFHIRMRELKKQLRRDEGLRSEESNDEEINHYEPAGPPKFIGKICPDDWNVKMLEQKLKSRGHVPETKRQNKVGKLQKEDWNLQRLEEKMRQQQMGPPEKEVPVPRPKLLQDLFKEKLTSMDARLKADGGLTQEESAKYEDFDTKVQQLEQQLHEGNMDVGQKGKNRVARMAKHMAHILDWDPGVKGDQKPPGPPPPVITPAKEPIQMPVRVGTVGSSSETCCFCQKRVYLMERLSAEGLFFHRSCFRCEYCGANLRLGHYAFDRTPSTRVRVFCPPHLNMQKTPVNLQKDQRFAEMMKRKHAFLSGSPLDEQQQQPSPTSSLISSAARKGPTPEIKETKNGIQPDVTLDGATAPIIPAVATLIVPAGLDTRDRTPERVEFENSLLELSEDELLTSELEEEELTQKNFGLQHDQTTSDDEYSDLSTDTESDEDYLIEELEKSFTADGTRKLAQTWQQKHEDINNTAGQKRRTSLSVKDRSDGPRRTRGEKSTGSTTPEAEDDTDDSDESDTETGGGDDTSDDIETDEEYACDDHKDEPLEEAVNCDIVMEVPVLSPNVVPEDSEEYTLSEDESDELLEVDGAEEGEGSQEDLTSSSEEEPLPPPHQIPVIVINESPPQVETDKDWAEEMASAMEEQKRNKTQKPESTELKENLPEEVLMQAVLEKLSTDTSSALTSPETCSQFVANQAEPSLLFTATLDAEEIPAECVQELVDIQQEAKQVAEELVHEIVSQAVASVSVRQELDKTKPSDIVTVFSDIEEEKANCDETNTTELKTVLHTDSPKNSLEVNSEAENTASNLEKPGDSKWDQIGKDLPPLVPGPTLNATRLSLDKFRFIAGAPSPRQQQYSPSKASISPKELASKLSEFHRKIEELQKQLPSPPVSSPPVTSSRPDFWKPRGTSPPILSCETYYQSLQEGIHVPESSSATLSKKPLPPLSINKLDMLPKKEGVLDDSTEVPNKPVPNENSKSVDVPKETRPELCPNQTLNCQEDSLPDNTPEKVKAVSPEMKRASSDHSTEKQSDTSFDSSIDFKNELEDAKTSPVMNTSDLSDELLELSKKYSFNPAYITLRKHNKLPASHIIKKDDDARSSVENLLDLGKYKRPMPKVIGVLSGGFTNSQPELSPVPKDVHMLPATNRPLMSSTPNQNSSSSPNQADVRFQGYGGSFADKVRPRSLVGDSIYLKSLSINLQKLAFPSLTKDSSFGGSCGTLKDEELKTTPSKKLSSASKSIEDILMGSPEERQDKFCPIDGSEQSMDHSISQSTKKEKLERVPFADDEKQSVASESVLGSVENMYNTTPNFGQSDSVYITPPNTVSKDLLLEMDEEYLLRTQRTAEQERARQEARERARMKSDEELGLSPCNYRKRYIQASSLSLGNYDELSSDDFLDDKDDMYEDDSDNEMDGVFHEKRVAFNERVQSVEAASSQQDLAQPNFNLTSPLSGGESGNATSSEKTLTTSSCSRTDSANYMESSLSPEDLFSSPEESKKSCTALLMPPGATLSSTESSPGTPDGPTPPNHKSKSKLKFNGDQKTEEEKPKSNGKKSFLSLLHFGRGSNSSKEKQTKNKSRSSSLPPDIRGRNKERSFALLKFTKGKDRSRDKQKKKVGDSVNESHTGAQNEQMMVVVRPKSASEPPEVNRYPPILKISNNNNVPSAEEIVPLQAVPLNLKAVMQMENGMAPKASVDSFTDTDEEASKGLSKPLDRTIKPPPPVSALSQWTTPPAVPSVADKEQRLMRMAQRVHRKQELKRFRTGQEIERRLQEIDILRKDLELKGVSCEKALRGETSVSPSSSKADVDLMQEWFALIRNRNKLEREEQELIIRMKDLELEERHSILQQEMRGRMAKSDDLKTKSDVEKERDILTEMLAIVEKRDELVLTLDQLKLREEVEDRDLENRMLASGLSPEAANR